MNLDPGGHVILHAPENGLPNFWVGDYLSLFVGHPHWP